MTAATWPNHLTVAVNVSPSQFATGSISDFVAETLKETGLNARQLGIEITESLLLADTEPAIAELRKIQAMGVAIVMDDFGTGFSALELFAPVLDGQPHQCAHLVRVRRDGRT